MPRAGWLLGLLVVTTAWAVVEPQVPPAYRKLRNPVRPTPAVMRRARALFAEQCAGCHGPRGRGDAPGVGQLRPPPADLTGPATVRASDQWLMWRISEGVPDTEMPAFREVLSARDRWALVLFVRSLAPRRR